jgi:hypothetical protein
MITASGPLGSERRDMKVIAEVVGLVVIAAIAIVAGSLVLTVPVYYLWNWLMPEIFGLTTLDFWQALGISLLAGCLFQRGGARA